MSSVMSLKPLPDPVLQKRYPRAVLVPKVDCKNLLDFVDDLSKAYFNEIDGKPNDFAINSHRMTIVKSVLGTLELGIIDGGVNISAAHKANYDIFCTKQHKLCESRVIQSTPSLSQAYDSSNLFDFGPVDFSDVTDFPNFWEVCKHDIKVGLVPQDCNFWSENEIDLNNCTIDFVINDYLFQKAEIIIYNPAKALSQFIISGSSSTIERSEKILLYKEYIITFVENIALHYIVVFGLPEVKSSALTEYLINQLQDYNLLYYREALENKYAGTDNIPVRISERKIETIARRVLKDAKSGVIIERKPKILDFLKAR